MEIVSVTEAMIGPIAALEQLCFSMPWTEDQLRTQLRPNHVFLAAVEEGRVAGYVGLMYVMDEGYISNVAVAPDMRRRGMARALLEELIAQSRALELVFLTLEVRESNTPAITLYESCGFQRVGLRKNYYKSPTEHAILMTLEF